MHKMYNTYTHTYVAICENVFNRNEIVVSYSVRVRVNVLNVLHLIDAHYLTKTMTQKTNKQRTKQQQNPRCEQQHDDNHVLRGGIWLVPTRPIPQPAQFSSITSQS